MDVGGGQCPTTNPCVINHRVSFLPVKLSTVDHVWGPSHRWNAWWWSLVCYLNWTPPPLHPPSVHWTSFTWWEFPALPHFLCSSASMYYTEHKLKNKKWGGLGTRLKQVHINVLHVTYVGIESDDQLYSCEAWACIHIAHWGLHNIILFHRLKGYN